MEDSSMKLPTTPKNEDPKEEPSNGNDKGNDDGDYDFSEMTSWQMLTRQLTICRLQKNLDPSWKQQAMETISPDILVLYAASSFCFTAFGVVLLIRLEPLQDALDASWQYPWIPYAIYLILQGLITTLSDVVYVDRPSFWHPVDRSFALAGMAFGASSLAVLLANDNIRQDHTGGICAAVGGAVLSIACFAAEWQYKAAGNIPAFVLCHTGWHAFAPFGYIALLLSL